LASVLPFVVNLATFRFEGRKFFLWFWLPVNFLLASRAAYLLAGMMMEKKSAFALLGTYVESWFGTEKFFGPDPLKYLKIEGAEAHIEWFKAQVGITVTWNYVIIVCVTLVMLAALYFVVQHTRMGRAMRAVSQNSDAARLMGINMNNVISFAFVLGSMLAAVGGCLYSLNNPQCTPLMGVLPGLKAFVAAVIGGIGNLPGAAMGGLVIALVETFVKTVQYNGTAVLNPYRDAIVFFVLILVLIVKPEGIFGKAAAEKV
jgi:branched-subunit amino acid ABC-type transport system permease component